MSKTVLITGTSSGIGKATAKLFADRGWNVIATLRRPEQAANTPPNVLTRRLDVQDPASIREAVQVGLERFGKIDAVVNNAGYGQYGLFEALSSEEILTQFQVNVFGVMEVTRAILPHFRSNGSGVIVNVSSGAGLFTLPMISAYCASKFALEGFSEALSYELASQGIAVKLVIPHGGVTETRFQERSASSSAQAEGLSDYNAFVAQTKEAFAKMASARGLSAQGVAEVIHEAVTDGSAQLRYLVGDDARGFVRARQTLPDQEYVNFMRKNFAAH